MDTSILYEKLSSPPPSSGEPAELSPNHILVKPTIRKTIPNSCIVPNPQLTLNDESNINCNDNFNYSNVIINNNCKEFIDTETHGKFDEKTNILREILKQSTPENDRFQIDGNCVLFNKESATVGDNMGMITDATYKENEMIISNTNNLNKIIKKRINGAIYNIDHVKKFKQNDSNCVSDIVSYRNNNNINNSMNNIINNKKNCNFALHSKSKTDVYIINNVTSNDEHFVINNISKNCNNNNNNFKLIRLHHRHLDIKDRMNVKKNHGVDVNENTIRKLTNECDFENLIETNQMLFNNWNNDDDNVDVIIRNRHHHHHHSHYSIESDEDGVHNRNGENVLKYPTVLKIPTYNSIANVPLRSKIDLAVEKRKARRNRNDPLDTSDSIGSDDEDLRAKAPRKSNLWITSGPPLKLDTRTDKMHFLQMFGLTSFAKRNESYFKQLDKQKWRSKWTPIIYERTQLHSGASRNCLDLPIPEAESSVLNNSPDFPEKSCFFRELGLRKMNEKNRDEFENVWEQIINYRVKKGHYSALTTYCLKSIEKRNMLKVRSTLYCYDSCKNSSSGHSNSSGTNSSSNKYHRRQYLKNFYRNKSVLRIPKVQRRFSKNFNIDQSSNEKNISNNHERANDGEIKQLSNSFSIENSRQIQTNSIVTEYKWMGTEQILEAYKEYSKEREIQIQQTRVNNKKLCDETKSYQMQIEYLDRRLQYLQNLHCLQNETQIKLEKIMEIYTNFLNLFR